MKKMMWGLAVLLFMAINTSATTLYFNFAACPASAVRACPGDFGTNQATYTDQGYSVTVYGYSGSVPTDLFLTQGVGLGLAGTLGNGVNPGQYLYLGEFDLAATPMLTGSINFSDLQTGQSACLIGTLAVGAPGVPCADIIGGVGLSTIDLEFTSARFLSITANSGGLVLTDLRTTPEPSTLGLFAFGLVGMWVWNRRRAQLQQRAP